MSKKSTKEREVNIEILRIISMLMIVTLHCFQKGILQEHILLNTVNNHFMNMCISLSEVAVNVYVLISGYFLVKSKFNLKKIVILWIKALVYSIGIMIIFILLKSSISLGDIIRAFMPVSMKSYWFLTTYIVLYFLFPFLNILINSINKKQFETLLIINFIIFCLWRNIMSFSETLDLTGGNGIIWFVFLYFVAAYIRLYLDIKISRLKLFIGYILMGIFVYLSKHLILKIPNEIIKGYSDTYYSYNSIFVFLGSVFIFLMFKNIKFNLSQSIKNIIILLSSVTFDVYLIHEQVVFRRILWTKILNMGKYSHSNLFIVYSCIYILGVFIVCSIIGITMKNVFKVINKYINIDKIENKFDYLLKSFDKCNDISSVYNLKKKEVDSEK